MTYENTTALGPDWMKQQDQKRQWMTQNSLYREEDERASCGVGLVVSINGKASRKVVENGIAALKAVWHRGAVDADGKTGDGAGIHVQIPVRFFYDQIRRTGHEPRQDELVAVGQVFLPRADFGAQETCRSIVESEVLRMGYYIYGWRHVPVEVSCLGEKANATRPEIEQILISNSKGVDEETFERDLYVIRRRIEKSAAASGVGQLYIASLSCRSIIYKGMMLAEHLVDSVAVLPLHLDLLKLLLNLHLLLLGGQVLLVALSAQLILNVILLSVHAVHLGGLVAGYALG